jgi:hypothetical protein
MGRHWRKPKQLSHDDLATVATMRRDGHTQREIARALKMSVEDLKNALIDAEPEPAKSLDM